MSTIKYYLQSCNNKYFNSYEYRQGVFLILKRRNMNDYSVEILCI